MPTSSSAVERKLQSKNGASIKRAKSFNSTSAPTSPSLLRRNKQPALEPRLNKSAHLLMEAKKVAKELEERKKKGLLRPQSAKTMNLGSRFRSGSNGTNNGLKKPSQSADNMLRSSAPVSLGKKILRRRAKSQHCRTPAQREHVNESDSDADEKDDNDLPTASFYGRLTPLRNSGRKRACAVPATGKSCFQCNKSLKSGFFSEHGGLSYCNVPCYSSLFSSLREDDDAMEGISTLSNEQKSFRASLIPKLRVYNTYYSQKPCQISCREINDKFVLEGVIKVYWGLRSPVTLADSEVSHYWKHFQPDDGTKRLDNTENVPPKNMRQPPPHKHDNKYKYKRKESSGSPSNGDGPKRRLGCSVCNNSIYNTEIVTSFIPPYGTPTTLRVTNHVTVPIVIDMLLKKFQIRDNRKRFSLYTVYESGGQRRLRNDSFPLLSRVNLGPCEDVAKLFIMDTADQKEITHEVAQYINFNSSVLETFVKKFHEEEEREVERIREKYKDYKELLMKRIGEFERNNNFSKEE
ncbi:ras association domain-containing protein 2-like [Clytia hemisphaerica]|uniref:Ras association domain-containing protein 2 n=1 Tax=Clytia hemisphaerica TaxID=252671 RepID=A0A7M5U5M5_9CNID|eukprot:TCONS_00000267-protein